MSRKIFTKIRPQTIRRISSCDWGLFYHLPDDDRINWNSFAKKKNKLLLFKHSFSKIYITNKRIEKK